jgi:molybdenum-dependent DNA-binding transcriptional regulator ModE
MPLRGADVWESDAYFSGEGGEQRQRKLVECPLPEIEDQQEQAVMNIWGNMTAADRDVTELLLTDGGEISPRDAADETGYSYRTIRRVVNRCEEIIEHTYGQLSLGSKHQRQMLLDRLHAAEQGFKDALEDAVLSAADEQQDVKRSRWSEIKRKYNIQVVDDPDEPYQRLIKVGYEPSSRPEAKEAIKEIKLAYQQVVGSPDGVCAYISVAGMGQLSYPNLRTASHGFAITSDTNYDLPGRTMPSGGSSGSGW